jgi:hypothetical protein
MAYDPEARQTSNSAMIIGIIALVLIAGAVLAYYATRQPANVATTTSNTVVIDNTSPAPTPAPDVVVVQPGNSGTVVNPTVVVPGSSTRVSAIPQLTARPTPHARFPHPQLAERAAQQVAPAQQVALLRCR